ncbi:MAG: efflux RND transporter permease subunit, partial [Planctomycetota bacterium]
ELPAGYNIIWSGQYEYMQAARARLMVIVPMAAVLIIVLLYLATHSWLRVGIVLLAVPFSLVGALWLLYLMDYNLSLAVWVGIIALAGLDAETGLVMLLYPRAACATPTTCGTPSTTGPCSGSGPRR